MANDAHEFGQFVGEVLKEQGQEDNQENKDMVTESIIEKNILDLREIVERNPDFGKDLDVDKVKELLKEKLLGNSSGSGEGQEKEMPADMGDVMSYQEAAQAVQKQKEETDVDWLIRRLREMREYLDKGDAKMRDVVSNATYKNAGKMLKVGIPREAILHAYALTWPERVRLELDIETYDPQRFGKASEGQHGVVPYVEALVEAEVPAMLVGPTQAGKGYLSRNIAENNGVAYGSVPLSAGTSIAWLFGRNMPQGFVGTDFIRCYESGGVFLLDEMDAADANLLIGINDALSNDELSNPVIDARIEKHEKFIPIAAANTFGLGADSDYTGRERLDMATLERWRMGRVVVDYDRELQVKIIKDEAAENEQSLKDSMDKS